jgi:hypothetical protein
MRKATLPSFAALFAACIFLLSSCRHPDDPVQPQSGKRSYKWTVDTLSYPRSLQTIMFDIWASSASDVYVVGHNDDCFAQMYHYDGEKWTRVHLAKNDGGIIIGEFDLSAIFGFSPTDIYCAGIKIYDNPLPPSNFLDSSMIIHYDGIGWSEAPIERGGIMNTIWGAAGEVWAGGYDGTMYHYAHGLWTKEKFEKSIYFLSISGSSSADVYASCAKIIDVVDPYDTSQYLLYHYDGSRWTAIDSFTVTPDHPDPKFGLTLWSSGALYSSGYGVFRREGAAWTNLLSSYWSLRINGSGNENIFAVSDMGRVMHWNGIDWKLFPELTDPNKIFYGSWTNNVETFIVGNDGRQTYILHGK